jgi:hypothetical protein
MMLVVKISPSFFVNSRGCGGRMGQGMAVGQMEDDVMMKRGE